MVTDDSNWSHLLFALNIHSGYVLGSTVASAGTYMYTLRFSKWLQLHPLLPCWSCLLV